MSASTDPPADTGSRIRRRRRRTVIVLGIALVATIVVSAVILHYVVFVVHIAGVNWMATTTTPNHVPGATSGGPPCEGNGLSGWTYTNGGNYPYASTITEVLGLQNTNYTAGCYVSNLTVSFSAPPLGGVASNLPARIPPDGTLLLCVQFVAPSNPYNWSIDIDYNAWAIK